MKLETRADGYWITDIGTGYLDCGPYRTKGEAEEDMRGVKNFIKYELPTDISDNAHNIKD